MKCINCGKNPTRQQFDNHADEQKKIATDDKISWKIEKDFCETTTCHGLSFWSTSKNDIQRFFWVLFVLGMVTGMTYQVYVRINTYLEYNATTNIKRRFVSEIDFPSVTICNYNRLFAPTSSEELQAMRGLNKVVSPDYLHFLQSTGGSINLTEISYFKNLKNFTISNYYNERGYDLSLPDTLLFCRYNYIPCTIVEFTSVLTYMGRCWTFNTGTSNQEDKKQYVAGSIQGLQIFFDVMQFAYTEDPFVGNQEAGIRFQVHSKNEPPNVLKYGLGIPVGRKAFAAIQRTDHNVINKPWGQCDSVNQKTLKYFSIYTLETCLQECYTDLVIEKCNCTTFAQYWARAYAPECTIEQAVDCSTLFSRTVEQMYTPEDCGCTIPCFYTDYRVTTSYATFPHSISRDVYTEVFNVSSIPNFIEENSVALDIGFEYIGYVEETQAKALDESGLLSEIGGQLGLWIGMSFVTIMEFIQYFTVRSCACVSSKRRRKRNRKNSSKSTRKGAWENGGYTEKM